MTINELHNLMADLSYNIEQQSEKLKQYNNRQSELERSIVYHQNMISYHAIPKKFKPPETPVTVQSNSKLTDEFSQQYETLFFSHLNKVLAND